MARSRSPAKTAAPLRMPRMRTSSSPASARIFLPRGATRLAVSFAENARFSFTLRVVARTLQPNFVAVTGPGHAEPLRNSHACDPDDDAVSKDERDAVSGAGVDFTINQYVFELFLRGEAQGLEAVADSAVADDERWVLSPP